MKTKLHETRNDLQAKTRHAMIELLNQQLADVIDLGMQAKQAHWNVWLRPACKRRTELWSPAQTP